MKIVLTGSLGNITLPLTKLLVAARHTVTVISRSQERVSRIEALGAAAAIGEMQDVDFLVRTFTGADIVYLMESWEGAGSLFDGNVNFPLEMRRIGTNYREAVLRVGITRVVHLSSIGAHTDRNVGSLSVHHEVENILRELPASVGIKFVRPVGFYTNLYRSLGTIIGQNAIVQAYGGDRKEPWVAPRDIAATIAELMEQPFGGRSVHYVASEELSPDEVAATIGRAIGRPDLRWVVMPPATLREQMRKTGMNDWVADGFIAMQAAQADGSLFEDYHRHHPTLGPTKLADFAREFATVYHQQIQK